MSEKKVTIIVNLASLEIKSNYYGEEDEFEYWPSDQKQPLELPNGIKVVLLKTEEIGPLLKR